MGAADYLLLTPPRVKTFSQVRELRMGTRRILGQQHSIGTIYTICPFAEASLFALGPQYISNQSLFSLGSTEGEIPPHKSMEGL